DRYRAARLLRRNPAQRSTGYLAASRAGASHQRPGIAVAPTRFSVAARDWQAAARRGHRGRVATAHRHFAPMATQRKRISTGLDTANEKLTPEAEHKRRPRRCRCRG